MAARQFMQVLYLIRRYEANASALTCVTIDVKLTDGSITFITVTTNYN